MSRPSCSIDFVAGKDHGVTCGNEFKVQSSRFNVGCRLSNLNLEPGTLNSFDAQLRANLLQHARSAQRPAGFANPPAVPDHAVRKIDPFLLRKLLRSRSRSIFTASSCSRQAKALRKAGDVRIDHHAAWRCERPCPARRWPSCGRRPADARAFPYPPALGRRAPRPASRSRRECSWPCCEKSRCFESVFPAA